MVKESCGESETHRPTDGDQRHHFAHRHSAGQGANATSRGGKIVLAVCGWQVKRAFYHDEFSPGM